MDVLYEADLTPVLDCLDITNGFEYGCISETEATSGLNCFGIRGGSRVVSDAVEEKHEYVRLETLLSVVL